MRRKSTRESLIESCSFANNEEELNSLAGEIRLLFPKGTNIHTHTLNRQPARELADALLRFDEYYQLEATKEEILEATRKYVKDKEYDPYRQCSKYFIIKDLTREGKGITSALANYIEASRDSDGDEPTSSWLDEVCD